MPIGLCGEGVDLQKAMFRVGSSMGSKRLVGGYRQENNIRVASPLEEELQIHGGHGAPAFNQCTELRTDSSMNPPYKALYVLRSYR